MNDPATTTRALSLSLYIYIYICRKRKTPSGHVRSETGKKEEEEEKVRPQRQQTDVVVIEIALGCARYLGVASKVFLLICCVLITTRAGRVDKQHGAHQTQSVVAPRSRRTTRGIRKNNFFSSSLGYACEIGKVLG